MCPIPICKRNCWHTHTHAYALYPEETVCVRQAILIDVKGPQGASLFVLHAVYYTLLSLSLLRRHTF